MTRHDIARLLEELQAMGDRDALNQVLVARVRAERGSDVARVAAVEVQLIAEGGLHVLGRAPVTARRGGDGVTYPRRGDDTFGVFASNRTQPRRPEAA
jgi:hypothetical protein